ncbi:DUF362 domain-containing protein [Candidatus Pacearchaeota archaeon]|nr:DUF362 domain-containing protein [Candidatus Pacearchaeota archaeon]
MHKVSIVTCNTYNNEEVKQALLDSLKNIDFNFKNNLKILIKPNILGPHTPEQGITTHPIIIEELCKILKNYNADIYIGDSSGLNTKKSLIKSKISNLSKYATIINFDEKEKNYIKIGKENISIPKIVFNVDLIINMPKLKTHGLTRVTLSVKNLYGCIQGKTKAFLHVKYPNPKNFSKLLINLENKIKPQLNIIDGIIGLEGNGPGTAGTPIKSNIIITSKNPYANDIITSNIMGFNPYDIHTNKFSNIKIQDIETIGNSKNLKLNFKKPNIPLIRFFHPLLAIFPKPKITFEKDKCIRCLKCQEKCPTNAIIINPNQICYHKKCIRCLCCIEVCPNAAIYLKDHWTKNLIKKVYRKLYGK